MDLNAVNRNITIDDFDSVLTYSDQAQWSTPDPSANNFTTNGSPWLTATYHNTTVKGASVSLNFTGAGVYLYGAQGPAYGSYELSIDGKVLKGTNYRQNGSNNASQLIFGASDLTFANHQLVLSNAGANGKEGNALLFDYAVVTAQMAPAGATVKDTTFEETDPGIKYSGTWASNKSPLFSGGGSAYTDDDGGSFEFSFEGSAIYIFGDKKNDHRGYTVTLDSQPSASFNGTSGCGGAFGLTCEQQNPCLKFLATNLGEGNHTVKVINNAKGPAQSSNSFFDLDSIVITVPSVYAPRNLSTSSSPFLNGSDSGSSDGSSSSGSSSGGSGSTGPIVFNGSSASPLPMTHSLLLLIFGIIFILRPWSNLRK
ncbi:hypothetical protein CPB83DRAFT_284511 [Crepidotus variabilis]|uniref:Uncharacterized protein n=1 Tax=Crepidotus variabilis TaxID=179855 RepID=A0A9P6JR25_9AGAR|nr:hypothetical protein CPB83DRAFT_284511 [Crepidotus variabilis]